MFGNLGKYYYYYYYLIQINKINFCNSGVSAEGVLIITATGMLGTFLIPTELSNINLNGSSATQHTNAYTLPSVTKSLSHTRYYITTADICYGRSNFIIYFIIIINLYCRNVFYFVFFLYLKFCRWSFYDCCIQW